MKIEISQEDFGTLCICALRYCHGRRTYMPSLVQGIARSHFKDLPEKSLKVIADDNEYQARFDLWGDACDRHSWLDFYADLKAFMERSE